MESETSGGIGHSALLLANTGVIARFA